MENYFKKLDKIACDTEKKNNLTYVSWADAWKIVKEEHPDSTYTIYENQEGFPFWESKFGIDVKVWVTINGIEHIVRLPVMDWANKSMKDTEYEYMTKYWKKKCDAASAFDINKTIQRAMTKAIAMHGIGLYVYRWEDFPNEEDGEQERVQERTKQIPPQFQAKWLNYEDLIEIIDAGNVTGEQIKKIVVEDGYKMSKKAQEAIQYFLETGDVGKDLKSKFFKQPN